VNILLVYPCVFSVAQKLTYNEYALWMGCVPRFAYMDVGKGREPWMAETLKTNIWQSVQLISL